jgi:hypothetical protein
VTCLIGEGVLVNGLIDCSGSPEEAAAEAVMAVKVHQYGCLKIKVPPPPLPHPGLLGSIQLIADLSDSKLWPQSRMSAS